MKIPLRSSLVLRSTGVAVVAFCCVGLSLAVPQDKPASAATSSTAAQQPQPPQAATLPKDVAKKQTVAAAAAGAAPAATESGKVAEKEAAIPEEDSARKALEIAGLQKELKAKQERVEMLMRLFVADEQQFLRSPLDPIEDPQAKARIRAEQEELRAQSAACARLQARLEALTASSSKN